MTLNTTQVKQLAHGGAKLRPFGRPIPTKLNRRERELFEQAQQSGFVTMHGLRPNLRNVWYHWCEATRRPAVYVEVAGKGAKVELDAYTAHEKPLSDDAQMKLSTLALPFLLQCDSDYGFGPLSGFIRSVPIEIAEGVARAILIIITQDWKNSRSSI